MSKIIRILILITICYLLLWNCNPTSSENNSKIIEQQLVYDSITYKEKGFNIELYSTIIFQNKSISRKEYNNFLLIIDKDTFPMIPEVNKLKIRYLNSKIKIKYISNINFKSIKYDDVSIKKNIINYAAPQYSDNDLR